jgi:hypothetical protein
MVFYKLCVFQIWMKSLICKTMNRFFKRLTKEGARKIVATICRGCYHPQEEFPDLKSRKD